MSDATVCDTINFRLTIEYDGTDYHGWQRQADQPTIQSTIEHVLSILVQHPVTLIGSGRTDAGVHALGQVAHCHCRTRLSADRLMRGMNALLPDDIVIRECREAPASFHARYDATGKTYCYHILNRPQRQAVGRRYAWHIEKPLDMDLMATALASVIGTHDFSGFEKTGSPRSSPIRTLYHAAVRQIPGNRLIVTLTADGFLRCMVRNIVGMLVEVGIRRFTLDQVQWILESGQRGNAVKTAPAHGLFLAHVAY